ncbi:MAG: L-threonylcarbamoyladenylate synthase [Flavobacteriales bacterium]|nr:L-threonylcarbamoyladenylate synthase [Flavobacteriales bacterium]
MKVELNKAHEVLKAGGIILYPSDTIWGIGCDATNEEAVQRIFKIKQRSDQKSLIALVESDIRLERTVEEVPVMAWDLIDYSERPVTIIYDAPKGIAPSAINTDNTLGIRIVKDPFCKKLIQNLNQPIISTSANISGEKQANCFSEISEEIKNSVDHIVNLRQDEQNENQSSMIIKLDRSGLIKIIRK